MEKETTVEDNQAAVPAAPRSRLKLPTLGMTGKVSAIVVSAVCFLPSSLSGNRRLNCLTSPENSPNFYPAQDRISLPTLTGVRQSAQMRSLAFFALGGF